MQHLRSKLIYKSMTLFFDAGDTDEAAEQAKAMIRREKKVKRLAKTTNSLIWCGKSI